MPFSKHFSIITIFMTLSILLNACKDKSDKPTLPPPVKVTVIDLSPSEVSDSQKFSGIVTSAQTTTVSFPVGGTIVELYAREGQNVAKGQLLGKIRSDEYQNAYNIAQAQLAEAQDGYNRLKKLHDANALPEVKWVEMEQKLKQASNAAEMAKRTLDDATLYSPATGTVTQKFADQGQTVMPVQPIYEIVSTTDLEIEISVSENQIGYFYQGQKASVSLDTPGVAPFEAKVTSKAAVADPLTRTFNVKLGIPKSGNKILPGMIGTVVFSDLASSSFSKDTVASRFVIPSQAVMLNDDNRWFVWVVADSMAQRKFITAEEMTPDGVIVSSGLKRGDRVIVDGIQKVGTGTKVCPIVR